MAQARLGSRGRQELDAESLVHESYLRLAGSRNLQLSDSSMFYGYVGRMMHSIVIDHLRAQQARKRGGDTQQVALTNDTEVAAEDAQLPALNAALQQLERLAPRYRGILDLRYFAGLSLCEIAVKRDTSVRTVERELQKARAALRALMEEP